MACASSLARTLEHGVQCAGGFLRLCGAALANGAGRVPGESCGDTGQPRLLLEDHFERITLYNDQVTEASATMNTDSSFSVTVKLTEKRSMLTL